MGTLGARIFHTDSWRSFSWSSQISKLRWARLCCVTKSHPWNVYHVQIWGRLRWVTNHAMRFIYKKILLCWSKYFLIDLKRRVLESNSESDEECESNHFSYLRARQENWKTKRFNKDSPSKMCVSVNIGKGSCTSFCPLKVIF